MFLQSSLHIRTPNEVIIYVYGTVSCTKLHHLDFVYRHYIRKTGSQISAHQPIGIPSQLDLPQSCIVYHSAHVLPFHLIHVDKANDSHDDKKASGAGAHHTHTSH